MENRNNGEYWKPVNCLLSLPQPAPAAMRAAKPFLWYENAAGDGEWKCKDWNMHGTSFSVFCRDGLYLLKLCMLWQGLSVEAQTFLKHCHCWKWPQTMPESSLTLSWVRWTCLSFYQHVSVVGRRWFSFLVPSPVSVTEALVAQSLIVKINAGAGQDFFEFREVLKLQSVSK